MKNYKEVCKNEEMVWFEVSKANWKDFLAWAKSLGCVWISGKEITLKEELNFFHIAITNNGIIAFVPSFSLGLKKHENVPRYKFCKYMQKIKFNTANSKCF